MKEAGKREKENREYKYNKGERKCDKNIRRKGMRRDKKRRKKRNKR